MHPILAQYERDETESTTTFEGLPGFQFAYQNIYKGGEESALSTFSDIAVPQAYYNQGAASAADLDANNKCVLNIPAEGRTKEISEVRILRRIGNKGTWAVVDELTVEDLEGSDNTYNFFNRSIAGGFPAQTAIKPFDNLPQKAEAQAIVSDRLVYGNYVEGYDNVPVTASSSVTYHERPDDFKEIDVKIIPTLRFVSGSESDTVPNKKSGFFIDTAEIQPIIESGTTLKFNFSLKPNRNFHIYNSNDSFHGSRHLSVSSDVEGFPKVVGDGAEDVGETRENELINSNLDTMFGANEGVSLPGLKWTCTDSQGAIPTNPIDVVFGTSAANPFILRGHPLNFSVTLKTKNTIESANIVLKRVFTTVLSGGELIEDDQGNFEILASNIEDSYNISEGLPSGVPTAEESIELSYRIPVSAGADDRKHLIVSLLKKELADDASDPNDLKHQTPCGYFIVNKADPTFGFRSQSGNPSDGFLELDLKSLGTPEGIETLTAIPFIDAEKWKDQAFSASASGGAFDGNNNNPVNWGLRDATLWSLDSLIIDSWYCYTFEFLSNANLNPKIFTNTPTDFPRYMNGSNDPDLGPGSLNPNVTGSIVPGDGKNAAIVNIDDVSDPSVSMNDKFIQDTGENTGNINSYYKVRYKKFGFVGEYEEVHLMPFLQATTISDQGVMRSGWSNGRNLIVGGFPSPGTLINEDTVSGMSLIDGAIGPGGAFGGEQNMRHGFQGSSYAVGSVSGEMVFSGRIAGRGFFNPEEVSGFDFLFNFFSTSGVFVNFNDARGYASWFSKYGLEPMLPYFGGISYQEFIQPGIYPAVSEVGTSAAFDLWDIGFIPNWFHGKPDSDGNAKYDFTNVVEDPYVDLNARFLGEETHFGDWGNINNLESDLETSESIGDATILITGRELSLVGGGSWLAGGRSFKTRANHAFGIVYYDERGRSGKVNPIVFDGSPGVYVKGYSPSERGTEEKGRVSINIDLSNVTPPSWAHNFQIVYGGNTTKSNFIQYSTGGAFVSSKKQDADNEEEVQDESSTNIYVSLNYLQGNKDVSYAEAFGAVSPLGTKNLYTYKPGDKLRVLSYYSRPDTRIWVENTEFEIIGVEDVSPNQAHNIFENAFESQTVGNDVTVPEAKSGQFLVLKNNPAAEGFNFSSVYAGKNETTTDAHKWNNVCVVEIYSPSKEIDIESRLFYETGQMYDVAYAQNAGNLDFSLVHTPSSVTVSKGDVWFKPVALAVAEYGEDPNATDGDGNETTNPYYLRFRNLIGRLPSEDSDPGSSPRFRNYYVESMTFNDGFAGNNVLGIGKPNTVDKDVFQVRKGSSVIYSDKHDFSKRGLRFPSFNGTASNWKDLPNEHGKINFLLNNYDSLMCIQENKSSSIPVERNIISDASGANTLITSNKVIGVQAFFAGEYGCDNNPESVVKTDAATYFASKAKSEVYRLTSQGIQVISKEGMASYFFRLFEEAKKAELDGQGKIYIPGGYDPLKDEFLVTISNIKSFNTTGEEEVEQDYINPPLPDVPDEEEEEGIQGCMDVCSTTFDASATVDDESCEYFDFASFDYFSDEDGKISTDDIKYCYEVVRTPGHTLSGGFTSDYPGMPAELIKELGWDFKWILQQNTVDKDEDGKVTGGTYCMKINGNIQEFEIPMGAFSVNWNGGGWSPYYNAAYDLEDNEADQLNFAFALWNQHYQQYEDSGLFAIGDGPECDVYGCTDINSSGYDQDNPADYDCDNAPSSWYNIREYLENETDNDEDLPWTVCTCPSEGIG